MFYRYWHAYRLQSALLGRSDFSRNRKKTTLTQDFLSISGLEYLATLNRTICTTTTSKQYKLHESSRKPAMGIARRCAKKNRWPARSLGLPNITFYFWGHLRHIVYSRPVGVENDFVDRIFAAATEIKTFPVFFNKFAKIGSKGAGHILISIKNFKDLLRSLTGMDFLSFLLGK